MCNTYTIRTQYKRDTTYLIVLVWRTNFVYIEIKVSRLITAYIYVCFLAKHACTRVSRDTFRLHTHQLSCIYIYIDSDCTMYNLTTCTCRINCIVLSILPLLTRCVRARKQWTGECDNARFLIPCIILWK